MKGHGEARVSDFKGGYLWLFSKSCRKSECCGDLLLYKISIDEFVCMKCDEGIKSVPITLEEYRGILINKLSQIGQAK